jgi:hypothetical protein
VAVVARKSGPLDASSFATTIDSHATLVPVIALWPAIASSAHSTPPPFDAVIVYSHLTAAASAMLLRQSSVCCLWCECAPCRGLS